MDKSKTILDKIRLLFKSEETEETPVVVAEVVAEVKLEETPVVVAEVVSEVVAEVKLEETPLEVKPEETAEETALTIEEEVAALIERVDILEGIIKELVPAEVPEEVPEEEMDKDKIIAELKSQLEDKPAATPIIEKNENADKKSSHFNTMSSIINAQRLEKYGVGY